MRLLLFNMPKKRTKKSSPRKKSEKLEEKIIANLVELQKVHSNLAEKFDKLAEQISQLLSLFELSAKAFAEQSNIHISEKDKQFLEKVDKLLEQNKTIAKGLTLMEDRMRSRVQPQMHPRPQPPRS